jgi:hypothetical protein
MKSEFVGGVAAPSEAAHAGLGAARPSAVPHHDVGVQVQRGGRRV